VIGGYYYLFAMQKRGKKKPPLIKQTKNGLLLDSLVVAVVVTSDVGVADHAQSIHDGSSEIRLQKSNLRTPAVLTPLPRRISVLCPTISHTIFNALSTFQFSSKMLR
jgi:hypothetical protein